MQEEETMPVMEPLEDEEEGSGSDPQIMDMEADLNNTPPPSKSFLSVVRTKIG